MPIAKLRVASSVVIAFLAAGYFLYGAAKAFIYQPWLPEVDAESLEVPLPVESTPVMPLSHFEVIQDRNVFKAAVPLENSKTPLIENLPVAQLRAKLLGTIDCDISSFSRAIILEGSKQRLVSLGDPLGGYIITEVQRRALVLTKRGEKKVLLIELGNNSGSAELKRGIP